MKLVIEIPNSLYANIKKIQHGSIASKRLLDCVKNGTPLEEKTGHWVKTPKAVMGEGYMWYCDKCEYQVYQDSSRPYPSERYCPNCGCRMVEPQESEDV